MTLAIASFAVIQGTKQSIRRGGRAPPSSGVMSDSEEEGFDLLSTVPGRCSVRSVRSPSRSV
eukprot:15449933-Alexandrium_andersonii.AAC.1